jgi:hypothetical protein
MTAVAGLAAAPGAAHAGRSFFGWLPGSEVMPERSVELQNWIEEQNRVEDDANRSDTVWGVAPLIGVTDQLELGLPVYISWDRVPNMNGRTALSAYGVEARYRLVTQDPQDAPAFAPLIRASVERLVLARETMHTELGFVSTYEARSVVVGAVVNLSGDFTRDDHELELYPGLGVSVAAVNDLRVGAEIFGEMSLDDTSNAWVSAGPNLAWTHGRFWLSAAYGIGLTGIKDAPRMQWGIAF